MDTPLSRQIISIKYEVVLVPLSSSVLVSVRPSPRRNGGRGSFVGTVHGGVLTPISSFRVMFRASV